MGSRAPHPHNPPGLAPADAAAHASTDASGPHPPRWGSPLLQRLGRRYLARRGWEISGRFPSIDRSIVIVAPHSSNWDFIVGMATSWAVDVRATFVGKHTLFWWPLGVIMRWLGGIPVNRRTSAGFVERATRMVAAVDRVALVITPEGTRGAVDRWRTGFYHIASESGLPVIPAFIDWGSRRVGFGEPFWPTGEVDADIAHLQRFYSGFRGRR